MNTLPSLPITQLQLLLLDLISPARAVTQAQLNVLSTSDWETLMGMARQHRLMPLLHWQLDHAHSHLIVPPDIKTDLASDFKKAMLRSLMLQREIVLLHHILTKANIPYVALKGSYLAFHVYPHPALRPLRDIDILVPRDKTLEAYQLLIDQGLSRIPHYPGNPEATILLKNHLPPLRSSGQINIELHHRIFDYEKDGMAQNDPSDTTEFWERCSRASMANEKISFQSPTDLLLHLIEHAVYHHKFDNGPLLLSDLAYLITNQVIDWPLFWERAKKCSQLRGCLLALKLTQHYWDVKAITWPQGNESQHFVIDDQINTLASLMLQDFINRSNVYLQNELNKAEGFIAKVNVLMRKAFPSKTLISSNYPVSKNNWRIYLYYPIRWHRQIKNRLYGFLKFHQQNANIPEVNHLNALKKWLAG